MSDLTISVPDEIFAQLKCSPRELEQEMRLAAAIDWFRRGLLSPGRAAEIAGVARADFIDALAARKIDVFQVDLEDLKREMEIG